MLSGILRVRKMVQQAQSWAGGGTEPWVETAKGIEEKGCVDVEQGGDNPLLCLTRYLITYSTSHDQRVTIRDISPFF